MGDLFLPLEGLIDFDAERERLAKELKKTEKEIEKAEASRTIRSSGARPGRSSRSSANA